MYGGLITSPKAAIVSRNRLVQAQPRVEGLGAVHKVRET